MKELNILIVGVGGQGTLLASVLLGNLAMNGGYDVKLSEVHGMAQRGGSVVTHVRMGEQEVCAPVIDRGGADIIVAFEMLEAYRWVEYLKKGGKLFVNRQRINPMPVIMGTAKYPDDIEGFLKRELGNVTFVDADVYKRQYQYPSAQKCLFPNLYFKFACLSKIISALLHFR